MHHQIKGSRDQSPLTVGASSTRSHHHPVSSKVTHLQRFHNVLGRRASPQMLVRNGRRMHSEMLIEIIYTCPPMKYNKPTTPQPSRLPSSVLSSLPSPASSSLSYLEANTARLFRMRSTSHQHTPVLLPLITTARTLHCCSDGLSSCASRASLQMLLGEFFRMLPPPCGQASSSSQCGSPSSTSASPPCSLQRYSTSVRRW